MMYWNMALVEVQLTIVLYISPFYQMNHKLKPLFFYFSGRQLGQALTFGYIYSDGVTS